jgi:hypothetical protein
VGERSTMQRYNLKNALSSISGYILQENAIEKSILQNIKTNGGNREGDVFSECFWELTDGRWQMAVFLKR